MKYNITIQFSSVKDLEKIDQRVENEKIVKSYCTNDKEKMIKPVESKNLFKLKIYITNYRNNIDTALKTLTLEPGHHNLGYKIKNIAIPENSHVICIENDADEQLYDLYFYKVCLYCKNIKQNIIYITSKDETNMFLINLQTFDIKPDKIGYQVDHVPKHQFFRRNGYVYY